MTLLAGKTAIITGAGSGIGRATAILFAEQGASVIINARKHDALDEIVAQIEANGGKAFAVAGDVMVPQISKALVDAAFQHFGSVDVAVNNVGFTGSGKPLSEVSVDEWHQVIDTNLSSAFYGIREQIPAMLKGGGGSIILVSSFVGNSVGLPGMGAYAAAKAGLLGLAKAITAEYGSQNIRANALLPGGTATAMLGDNPAQRTWAEGLHAMKRIAEPEEIAQAALFLASDMSSFVTGSALWADGGNSSVKL